MFSIVPECVVARVDVVEENVVWAGEARVGPQLRVELGHFLVGVPIAVSRFAVKAPVKRRAVRRVRLERIDAMDKVVFGTDLANRFRAPLVAARLPGKRS